MYRGVADFLESEKSAEKSGYVWVSFFVENPCSDDFSGTRRGDWHRCLAKIAVEIVFEQCGKVLGHGVSIA